MLQRSKQTKEETKEKMTKEKSGVWLIRIYFFMTLITVISLFFVWQTQSSRLNNIECAVGMKDCVTASAVLNYNPLDDWDIECSKTEIVEHVDFVGETLNPTCANSMCYDRWRECDNKCGWKDMRCINACDTQDEYCSNIFRAFIENPIDYATVPSDLIIEFKRKDCIQPSKIVTWNETICTQEILVRNS